MASSREAMGREEPPPSKKRIALRQINKDDDPESEEEDGAASSGTFRRASAQVLAERRIVKVRRTPLGPSSGPNPFAAIRLVSPVIPASQGSVAPLSTILLKSDSTVSKIVVGGGELEPRTTVVQGETHVDNQKGETVIEGDVAELESIEAGEPRHVEISTLAPHVKDECAVHDVAETKLDSVVEVMFTGNIVDNNVLSGEEEVKARSADVVGPSGTSSETFEQLSSAKNAFAGSFGTGFSSSPSIVNSSSLSHVSSGFAFGQPFTFGSSTTLGLGQSQLPFGTKSGIGGVFPVVSSVFGNSNGRGSAPLFGSLSTSAAAPRPAIVSLQEILVETGEEKEKAIFTADASLFEFLDGGWKERGKGELRLNIPEEKDKRPRLVMRSKGNYRLLLNASLFPDMKFSKMDNRGISFVCANSAAEGKTGLTTYAVKLKDGVLASQFTATVQAQKGSTTGDLRTPESSP